MGGSSGPSGSTTSTTVAQGGPPGYAQPYVKQMLEGAQQRYESAAPEFYPEATYVPASSETETGLAGITAGALQGSPIANAGQQEYLNTLQGNYLSPDSNPFLQGAIDAATRPVIENYNENIVPSINSTFSKMGRYGSEPQINALQRSQEGLGRTVGDIGGNMAYQNYANERGIQSAAIQGAPDYANRRFDDARTLLDVGGAREGYSGDVLQDSMARYDFAQNQPQLKVGEYGSNIARGVYGGSQNTTQTTPYFKGGSAATGALGGAASGAAVGSAFGPYGALAGAAIGGAGGYAGSK